jgi:hypothetical protein
MKNFSIFNCVTFIFLSSLIIMLLLTFYDVCCIKNKVNEIHEFQEMKKELKNEK